MKKSGWIIGAAAFALAQPAAAQIFTATVDGIIAETQSGDAYTAGVFGNDYQVLNGQSFHAVFTFDLSQSGLNDAHYTGTLSDMEQLAGGGFVPAPAFGRVKLTIAGSSVSATGLSLGYISAGAGERDFAVEDWHDPASGYFELVTNFFDPSLSFPANLKASGSWAASYDYDLDAASPVPSQFLVSKAGGIAAGRLTPTSLSISIVPEPTTWATMLAGFAMIGAGLRTRRRVQARA